MPDYTITITECYHMHINADNEDEAIDQAFDLVSDVERSDRPLPEHDTVVVEHSIIEGHYRIEDCSTILDHLHKL